MSRCATITQTGDRPTEQHQVRNSKATILQVFTS